jgi:hypothetical protein
VTFTASARDTAASPSGVSSTGTAETATWPRENLSAVDDPGVDHLLPGHFAITESSQMPNARVYANAASWARLADRQQDTWTHVDEGWLLQAAPDRQWGAGLLPNVLIYNREVLLVLDRNGGRISHIFTRRDGREYCVSGHTYVCGDTVLARPFFGYRKDPQAAEQGRMVGWLYPNTFDEYDGAITGPDAFSFVYQAGTEPSPAPGTLTDQAFVAAYHRDRAARTQATGTRVIWHDPHHVGFRKTIRLDARTVTVSYEGVRPGHVVANEFCVHLQGGLRGESHVKAPADDGTAVGLDGPDGIGVRLTVTANCRFTPEALLTGVARDPIAEINRLRLYRVVTDNLELVCDAGGDFAYRIDL